MAEALVWRLMRDLLIFTQPLHNLGLGIPFSSPCPPSQEASIPVLASFNQRRAAVSLSLPSHPNQEAGAKTPREDPRIWGCETLRAD